MQLAPIVLFVYNRPDHTQRILEALSTNELALDMPNTILQPG